MRRLLATTLTFIVLPAASARAEWQTLERGDRGDEVELVQRALTEVGIRTKVDGAFGAGTERNVRRYERREELPVDGRVSRGQARGLFKRAEMDTAVLDAPPAKATPRAAPIAAGSFPIQGEWEPGRAFGDGHEGVDLLSDCGTPLIAPEAGKVVRAAQQSSAGNYLVLRVASGEDHVFMHLQEPASVSKGEDVPAGTAIGVVGQTGNASTCHLHFEIWTAPGWYEGGAARDPKPDLDGWSGGAQPAPS